MKIRIAPVAKCLMASTAGGLMLAQFCGLGFSEAQAQQPSTIQQELQKLYESEGRQAPDMRLELLPRTTPDGRVFETIPQSERVAEPAPVTQTGKRGLLNKLFWWKKSSPPPVAPRVRAVEPQNSTQQPNSRMVNSPEFRPAQPQTFQQPLRPLTPSATSAYQSGPQQPRTYQQPRPLPANPVLQAAPAYSGQVPVRPASQPRQLPMNSSAQPHPLALPAAPPAELADDVSTAKPFPTEPKAASDIPNLDALPDEPLPLVPEEPKAEPKPQTNELFPDPFTEMSEAAADRNRDSSEIPRLDVKQDAPAANLPQQNATVAPTAQDEPKQEKLPIVTPKSSGDAPKANPFPETAEETEDSTAAPVEDENPFSGLKLEPAKPVEQKKPEIKITPKAPVSVEGSAPELPLDEVENSTPRSSDKTPQIPDIEPSIKNELDIPGTKETSEQPLPEMPKLEKIPESNAENDGGNFSWEEEQARQAAKLKLIAARKGETGLKGFCIVALRDDRDLKDALPQFRSTYNLRTYHFSNLESKIEFDKNPKKYVPSYDGNDPVLISAESEEREGSLDTALWFKGRLYLFVNEQNMKAFENDPVLYAEN